MTKRNFKILVDNDGTRYRFNSFAFKVSIRNYVALCKEQGNKITGEQVKKEIAEKLFLSPDAIKNWISGYNGPADMETVKGIADYLKITYVTLLQKEEDKPMSENREIKNVVCNYHSTKDVIRTLYQEMAEFMDLVQETTCFDGIGQAEYFEYVSQYNYLVTLLHKSMLDIPLDVYDKLEKIISSDFDFYINGYDWGMIDIWDCSEYDEFVQRSNYNEDCELCRAEYVCELSKKFYSEMRVVLKDYLIHS